MGERINRREALGMFAGVVGIGAAAPMLLVGCESRNPLTTNSRAGGEALGAHGEVVSVPAVALVDALTFRRSAERGRADHGWLKTQYSFSFSRYQDPKHMQFRALRVMNEDHIAPGGGFPMHPHRDMEILTYILDGALEHEDSMGNGSVIRPGEVQTMSAGTGIRHSEFNPSGSESVHLLQIWLLPDKQNIAPRYAQKLIPPARNDDPIRLIASPDGADGSVMMHQDARIHSVKLRPQQEAFFEVRPDRHAWVQVARGELALNKFHTLHQGDGVSTSSAGGLLLSASVASEVLIFDLA